MYINDDILAQYEKMQRAGKNPKTGTDYSFTGNLDKNNPNVYTGFCAKNKYLIRLQVELDGSIVKNIKFKAVACTIVLASMNMACEMLQGKPFTEALKLRNDYFKDALNIPKDVENRDAVMVEEAINSVVDQVFKDDDNG